MSITQRICETPFCGRKAIDGRKKCARCKQAKARLDNECTTSFHDRKARANKRGIPWGITLEEWKIWWEEHPEYQSLKGRRAADLTIDRKEEEYGYFIWNIQILTNRENLTKYRRWKSKQKGWSVAMKKEADDPF